MATAGQPKASTNEHPTNKRFNVAFQNLHLTFLPKTDVI
ncbi:hypothetical protein JCM19240_4197 [Vibrio maritimus]|uniref:Uncharacterized protein n=1 Tax=Vibrio maritimus TaxID=990268 RepID=A0A090TUH7_9VIBR|nr:hypothetical protein JCM19240_4197 [Vibrio maritimus]